MYLMMGMPTCSYILTLVGTKVVTGVHVSRMRTVLDPVEHAAGAPRVWKERKRRWGSEGEPWRYSARWNLELG
jgi:hypothetical protein